MPGFPFQLASLFVNNDLKKRYSAVPMDGINVKVDNKNLRYLRKKNEEKTDPTVHRSSCEVQDFQ